MDWSGDMDDFESRTSKWFHAGSNMMLDFHGDPVHAELVVFSDGNHNMALKETFQQFQAGDSRPVSYFYVTTPPGPIVKLLKEKSLQLGNLVLSVTPHVFMGPPHVLDGLVDEGYMTSYKPFVKNQGSVILVKKGNSKDVFGVNDLTKENITLFLSSPEAERVSFQGYMDTLKNLSGDPEFDQKIRIHYGTCIHHREAPEAVRSGQADAAVLFYHLALHYTRMFPGEFEIVPLGGRPETPVPDAGNVISSTHVGLVGEGGEFGKEFMAFLASDTVQSIYRFHGLIPL